MTVIWSNDLQTFLRQMFPQDDDDGDTAQEPRVPERADTYVPWKPSFEGEEPPW